MFHYQNKHKNNSKNKQQQGKGVYFLFAYLKKILWRRSSPWNLEACLDYLTRIQTYFLFFTFICLFYLFFIRKNSLHFCCCCLKKILLIMADWRRLSYWHGSFSFVCFFLFLLFLCCFLLFCVHFWDTQQMRSCHIVCVGNFGSRY